MGWKGDTTAFSEWVTLYLFWVIYSDTLAISHTSILDSSNHTIPRKISAAPKFLHLTPFCTPRWHLQICRLQRLSFSSKLKYVNCYSVCISSSMRLRPLTCSQCNCSANAFQSHLGKNPRSEDALKHLLISKVSMKKSVFVCMFQIFFVPLYLWNRQLWTWQMCWKAWMRSWSRRRKPSTRSMVLCALLTVTSTNW